MICGKLSPVSESFAFFPPRRAGVIFHLVTILALALGGAFGLYRLAYSEVGPTFLLYLLPLLLAIPAIPLLIYRLNNLQSAVYTLERDSLRLQWGLRAEVIPTNAILWVRPASDLLEKLRLPWVRWPGAVLGARRLPGGMPVEFMASKTRNLVLISTYDRVFAISPADPAAFIQAYQRLTELGSLVSPSPRSVHPGFLLARVWKMPLTRDLILASGLLSLALVVWVILIVPSREQVSLGFLPDGSPRDPIPGMRLMLLPILNLIFWVFDFFLGLVFFRQDETHPLALLLWGNSILVAGIFLLAVYFIS